MGLIIDGVSVRDLILDGQSVSLYEGGSPPVKVWPTREVVQITLGVGDQARDQFRAALTERGLDYQTITEVPFEIELLGAGSLSGMFDGCSVLTSVSDMDTSRVTNMKAMFQNCSSLTYVPDMDTSQVTDTSYLFTNCHAFTSVPKMNTSRVTNMTRMFNACSALTSVPEMDTSQVTDMSVMFQNCYSLTSAPAMDTSQVTDTSYLFRGCSALTSVPEMDTSRVTNMRTMFYDCSALTSVPDMGTLRVTEMTNMFYGCSALTDGNVRLIGRHPNVTTSQMISGSGLTREPFYTTDGQPWPTAEVREVSLTNRSGSGTVHPLVTVSVPAGEVWDVQIQGTVTVAPSSGSTHPKFRIGSSTSGAFGKGSSVNFSGTVSSTNATIAMVTAVNWTGSSFTGTVTIRK